MDILEAIRWLELMINENKRGAQSFPESNASKRAEAIETVLNALENSISKDRIRAKIEELEKDLQDFEQTDNTGRFIRTKSRDYDKKKALEELLEVD